MKSMEDPLRYIFVCTQCSELGDTVFTSTIAIATKAEADDVASLQTQQAINTAALTVLESHGTEGASL